MEHFVVLEFLLIFIRSKTKRIFCFFLVKNLVANEDEMYVSDGEVEQQDNDARYLVTSHDIL